MELVSIFINIAIVIFILLGYRQLDKNNRSLEKVKKYSDKVKENLSQFIDEKSADIRNIAIEIKVNLKTHNEILNRIREEGEKFKDQTALVIDINKKFQDYDKILKELDHSTLIVEENLKRIQNESGFVDKVGKDISTAKEKIHRLEKELPGVYNAFEKRNQESLQQLKESIMDTIKTDQETLSRNVTDVEKQLKDFAAFMSRLEGKKDSMEQETLKNITKVYSGFESNAVAHKSKLETVMNEKVQNIYNTAKLARDKFEKDLQEIEIKYQRHLQSISDKGIKMEHDALNALKATIAENSRQFNSEIDKTFSSLSGVVEVKSQEINASITDTREAVNQCNAGITNEIDIIKNTFNEKFSHLKADINAKIEDFILGNREKQKSLTQELAGLNQFSEQKIEKFKTEFTKSISEISSDLNSFKSSYLDKIKEAALAGEKEKEKLVNLVSANIDNTREVLTKNIEDLQADVNGVEKLKEAINARIEETNEAFKINNKQIVQRIDTFKAEVEKEISHSTRELETRVLSRLEKQLAEFESVSNYRIKKIEESNLDINNLEENISELLETRKEEITRHFNEYAADMEQKRSTEEIHTREIILGLTEEIKTLENTLLDLKTKAYQDVSEKLKVFEDGFFSDLKNRTDKMETSVLDWQAAVEQTLDKTRQKYTSERQLVEDSYTKELDTRVEALRKKGETGINQLLEFIKSEHNNTREYAKKLSTDIDKVCGDIKMRYAKMKETAGQENKSVEEIIKGIKQDVFEWKKKFHEEVSVVAEAGAREREKTEAAFGKELDKRCTLLLQNSQKELAGIYEKVKAGKDQVTVEFDDFRKKVESTRTAIQEILTENGKKITDWQAKLDTTTGNYQANFDRELAALKKNMESEIETITLQFTKQREEIILAANEEKIKTGAACSREIEKHYTELFRNSQAEITALGTRFGTIQAQLLAEYEEFKKRAQANRNEIQGVFAENDKKLASWQSRIDAATSSYLSGFDKELAALKKNIGKEMETLSREFGKQREELVAAATEERMKAGAACSKEIEKQCHTLMQSSRADIAALGNQFSTAREQMLGDFEELKKSALLSKNEILGICTDTDKKTTTWQSKMESTMNSSLAGFDKELAALKKSISSEIEKQRNALLHSSQADAVALGNQLKATREKISGEYEELKKAALLSKSEIIGICTDTDKKTIEWQAKVESAMNSSLAGFDKELAALKKSMSSEIEKQRSVLLQSSQADVTALGNQLKATREKISGEYEELKKAALLSKSEIIGICTDTDKKTIEWQAKVESAMSSSLAGFDKELAALKKSMSSEIEKQRSVLLQSSQADVTALGNQLKTTREKIFSEYEDMRKTAQLSKNEILGLCTETDKKTIEWQTKVESAMNSSLAGFDKELAALKKSMSSEIEKQRSALLQSSQADTAALGNQLKATREKIFAEYEELEKAAQLSRNTILGLCAETDEKIAAWQSGVDTAINSSLAGFERDLDSLKKSISSEMEKQHTALLQSSQAENAALGNQLNAVRNKILAEYEELKKNTQISKSEILNIFAENDEKMAAWQSRIDSTISSTLAGFNKEITGLKKSMIREIEITAKEFTKQREDLVLATSEERGRIKSDLKDFSLRLDEFNNHLKNRSKEIFEEFNSKYTNFKTDIVNSINNFQQETQDRIAAFKKTMQDSNTTVLEIQKGNMQKFEAEYKMFREKLRTIENQQHNFVEQTKLFERADKLKIMLKTSIDELKNDISRLEPEHQKMHAVEAELNKTKLMAEEVSGKLARFFAEKRRIDGMEKNFSKLIRISDDIGIKLDNVTATKDILQEIQLKMRDLEKMESDIDAKYDRLEKKNEIIEKTSKGIDMNFQSLETIHTGLKSLDTEFQALQSRMLGAKQELKVLTENKPKTDAVLKRIGDLNSVLTDIEQRMDKLQTAREWLSRTETRLENISKEADEQVKLMQSIVKAEADANKKRSKGAPPQDIRETVVKLASQGWSVKEISKATNTSQGEVELILELAPVKR